MAITSTERLNIIKVTVALFNAAPGAAGLSDFTNFYEANGKGSTGLNALVNNLNNNNTFKALNPNFQTADDFATSILSIYGLESNTAARDFVTSRFDTRSLQGTLNKAQLAFEVAIAINNTTAAVGDFANARAILNNKTLVAENYSVALSGQSTNISVLQNVLSGVTADAATIISSNNANASALGTITLTTGLDNLVGTASNNTFTANVVQNNDGAQTNQLATGDRINGGAGTDTLNAVVQIATPLGGTFTSSIAPITTSLEQTFYTALVTGNGLNLGLNVAETVNINAKSMTGLTKVGSVQSDASLLIQNLTTLTDTGVYTDRRNTETVAIRMDHTGNDRAPNAQANLTVLFDNDYLLSNSVNTNRLEIRLANNLPLKDTVQGLAGFASVTFKVGAIDVTTVIPLAVTNLVGPAAYAALKVLIEAQLTLQGLTGVAVNLLPVETTVFSIPVAGNPQGSLAGTFTPIEIVSTGGQLAVGPITLASNIVNFNGVNTETPGTASAQVLPITSNIELQKVGRGAEGGSLVVGAMSTDLANVFTFGSVALKKGIEQFNIVVSGDTTQMSSLSNLSSTNNTLQTVNVTYAAGSLADLNIGNKNTVGALFTVNGAVNVAFDGVANVSNVSNLGMKDVRTFTVANNNRDATNPLAVQTNDVTLNAYLSDEVVAKYMNRTDNAANAATDNANFVYTTGAGNDVLNLNISKSNLAASGTAAREDFTLTINAGAGNNTVTTQIGNGLGGATDAWYINQTIQKNLFIITGAGNDVVRVNGAGSWDIKTFEGNDAIYSDGSGRQVINTVATANAPVVGVPAGFGIVLAESNAVWVFNSVNQLQGGYQNLFNLTSAAAVADATKVANLELTVSYRGINVTVAVGDTAAAAGGTVNDLTINQAIKAAINGNVYLKNLLVAQDGTGRTLVVTSLTDGVFNDADLTISVANPTALTVAQTAAGAAFLTPAQLTALGLTAGTAVVNGRFDSAIAEDATTPTVETATVTFQAFVVAGTQSIGGLTITATGAFTAAQVAQIAGGGAPIVGLTVTTPSTAFTVAPAVGATNGFTSTTPGNVPNAEASAGFSGVGNTAPTAVTIDGTQNSIVGANSAQANTNVIDAGLGLDTVILSTAGLQARETVNVANVGATALTDADVVFNAGAGSTITVDAFDTVITTSGFVVVGGVGSVTVLTTGINGTAGNDTINGTNTAAGLTISGLAGNDTISASRLGSTVIGGDGADVITFSGNSAADTLVFNSLVGADTIGGYVVADDVISLSKAVLTGLGPVGGLTLAEFESNATGNATLATTRIIYNTTTGALNYDADGSVVTIANVLLATFTGIPTLVVTEFNIIA